MDKDDVRRVVRAWPEYGGIVHEKSAKKRRPEDIDLENIPFVAERAVFPLELLTDVAKVFADRALAPRNVGANKEVSIYALNGMTYCARCKTGVRCGCTKKSVPAPKYEADFGRLIKLLTIREDALSLMTELAIQADKLHNPNSDLENPEKQKQEAIALCRRQIEAAVILFGEGRIDKEEYRRRVEMNEREIAHWEARTTETEKAALELAMCMDAVEKLASLWDIGDDEDRQGMARSLFSYIVYDLDTRRIVDFRLKPWADRSLVLRSALYEDDETPENGSPSGFKPHVRPVAPAGVEPTTPGLGNLCSIL